MPNLIATWKSKNGKHTVELYHEAFANGDRTYSWSERRNGREYDHGAMNIRAISTLLPTPESAIEWFKNRSMVREIESE